MSKTLDFPEYSTKYATQVKPLRDALLPEHRLAFDVIKDELVEDPFKHKSRLITLSEPENMHIYKHPKPKIEIVFKVDHEKKIIYILHLSAPRLEVPKSLFISYSHKDEEWLHKLRNWLVTLEDKDQISIWDDTVLTAGDNWQEEIKEALDAAKAAVLLVSQDFLCSEFIKNKELPSILDKAEQEGLKILWISVRPNTVEETEIAKYQAVHKDPPLNTLKPADQEKKLKYIHDKIKEAIEK